MSSCHVSMALECSGGAGGACRGASGAERRGAPVSPETRAQTTQLGPALDGLSSVSSFNTQSLCRIKQGKNPECPAWNLLMLQFREHSPAPSFLP